MDDNEHQFTNTLSTLFTTRVDWTTLKIEGSGRVNGKTLTVAIELDAVEGES